MKFRHSVPILFSSNVVKSIEYYTDILGFDNKWEWGDPPTFGGVSKNGVEIFFCENGQGNPGTWLSIFIENVDEYYETLKSKGARILREPKNFEWGLREMLVQDHDDHVIRFGHGISLHGHSEPTMPSSIRIVHRRPTIEEYRRLVNAVGWGPLSSDLVVEKILAAPVFAVVAEDSNSNEAVGCAFLLGDSASFYYVKDVIVHPNWQNKRIGTAMMKELDQWLETHVENDSLVGLYTGEGLRPFYWQFGFRPAFGMTKRIKRV